MAFVVEGIHECSRGLVVSRECLGFTTPTRIAGVQVLVSFPVPVPAPAGYWRGTDVVLGAPTWTYMPAAKDWSQVYPDDAADAIWGRSTEPDMAVVYRFRFAFGVDDGHDAQAMVDRIAVGMREWWPRVESWVEVLTGQNITPTATRNTQRGNTFARSWTGRGQDFRTFRWPQMPLTARYVQVDLDRKQWARVMELAADQSPPLEWLLLRDARAAVGAYEFRLAIIDGGIAADMSLAKLNDELVASNPKKLSGSPSKVREAYSKLKPMLGDRIKVFHGLGQTEPPPSLLSLQSLTDVGNTRNLVAHPLGKPPPTEKEARRLLDIAETLVERAFPRALL